MNPQLPALSDLRTGLSDAWNVAFRRLWPLAVRVARRVAPQITHGEAEEAASDAIRAAIERIGSIESEDDLLALVSVIARRRAVTILREKFAEKRAPGGALVVSSDLEEDAGINYSTISDPSQDTIRAETIALLRRALRELTPEERQLLQEKYVEGFSYEQLSAKYNIPIGTLCPKIMRALRKVRARLGEKPELMKELSEALR
jgi:RNA polymerase sigma factor (sigma-70 family)